MNGSDVSSATLYIDFPVIRFCALKGGPGAAKPGSSEYCATSARAAASVLVVEDGGAALVVVDEFEDPEHADRSSVNAKAVAEATAEATTGCLALLTDLFMDALSQLSGAVRDIERRCGS